jgi:hypothetical protein
MGVPPWDITDRRGTVLIVSAGKPGHGEEVTDTDGAGGGSGSAAGGGGAAGAGGGSDGTTPVDNAAETHQHTPILN